MLLHMLPKVELYVFSQSSCLLFTYSCWDCVFEKVVMIISVTKVCHAMVRLKILRLFLIWFGSLVA